MKIKKNITIMLCFLMHNYVFSQNLFSKFYTSPLILNPANTGNSLGDSRFGWVYRTEKNVVSSNSRASFFVDTRILKSVTPENDKFAIGLVALSEKDIFNGIKNSYFLISGAYFKGLDEDGLQQLGVGFQADFSHKKIQPPNIVFENQLISWINQGFAGLTFAQKNAIDVTYFDFNVGLNYKNLINSKSLVIIGLSILHTNSPNKTFEGGTLSLSPEVCLQFGLEKTTANQNKLYCSSIISANTVNKKVDDYSIGFFYEMKINESKYKIALGGLYRKSILYGSVIMPGLGLRYNKFSLNLSYDVNVSKKNTGPQNAFELGMIFNGKRLLKK
jgi:type IX secretion system PorP/SprF family membrane protein